MDVLEYFNGDELASDTWKGKYKMEGEEDPSDMHRRMARELARVESKFKNIADLDPIDYKNLSHYGKYIRILDKEEIFKYFDRFSQIVPQGSIMSMLGNKYKTGSLSNCFVIPSPLDSYGGIMKTDEHLVQLMKRRGGVGMNLNLIRPADTEVNNAAGTSTGSPSFAERYSNSTREVAQDGRRGALMLLLHVRHPDIFKFVTMKRDKSKVTGANISVMLTDEFMKAVEGDMDFVCRFPIDIGIVSGSTEGIEYNKLYHNPSDKKTSFMKIRAKELFLLIVEMAWENAEPGVAFIDRVVEYSPDGVYSQFKPIASNPCGEQWMQAFDACRLLAMNFFSIVDDPFTSKARINYQKLYEMSYIQQRLGDDVVELELEYIDRIMDKILKDPEDYDTKRVEYEMWKEIYETTKASRRTGCGFTGLGDMLAALGVGYGSDQSKEIIERVMGKKMEAELDCTTDLSIMRGSFEGWNPLVEFNIDDEGYTGRNAFYDMLVRNFPDQVHRMINYGRRNVSWSTVAPTGTVSIMTQTTSGLEPLFLPYYTRRKKINSSDKESRVDFVDQNGDTWQEFPILHPKFKDWILQYKGHELGGEDPEHLTKEGLEELFKLSPWYGSTANDVDWDARIQIQAIIQEYTTNAISSTINLPNNVDKNVIQKIYFAAWRVGLKGITVYRDGCRTGVLVSDTKKNSFEHINAVKRPKELPADLHTVTVKGAKYGVIIGLFEGKPYEIFAFNLPEVIKKSCTGKIVKVKKGHYDFVCEEGILRNIQEAAVRNDELVLTRLVSGMLRHGAKSQFVMEQIDKCDLEVVSFGKAVTRVLKAYVKDDEMIARNKCHNCGSTNLRMQEGCLMCLDCGQSRCG